MNFTVSPTVFNRLLFLSLFLLGTVTRVHAMETSAKEAKKWVFVTDVVLKQPTSGEEFIYGPGLRDKYNKMCSFDGAKLYEPKEWTSYEKIPVPIQACLLYTSNGEWRQSQLLGKL